MVDVALGRDRGADAFGDQRLHDDHTAALVQERLDPVADLQRGCRLRSLAVDVDMPTSTRGGRLGAGLRQANGVQPLVDADGLDLASVAAVSTCVSAFSRLTSARLWA